MVAASERNAVKFELSGGEKGDAPEDRNFLLKIGKQKKRKLLLMDKAYEGDETHELAESLNFIPVVPPKSNRKEPWLYDKILYKKRNEVERIFNRMKRFRRIYTRYDKLDIISYSFIFLAFIFDALFYVNTL
jgi:transposase